MHVKKSKITENEEKKGNTHNIYTLLSLLKYPYNFPEFIHSFIENNFRHVASYC